MRRKLRTERPTQQTNSQPYKQQTNSTRIKWIVLLSLVILLLVIIEYSYFSVPEPKSKVSESDVFQSNFSQWHEDFKKNLSKYCMPSQWISGLNRLDGLTKSDEQSILLEISFPSQFSIHPFIFSNVQFAAKNNLHLIESYERLSPSSMIIVIKYYRAYLQ